ncbi:hypothetical protein ACOMHN_015324 [Nucella lapillus]
MSPYSREDEVRRRVDVAIEAEDEEELTEAASELHHLGTERALTEKTRVDHELNTLKMKRDLTSAETDRDLRKLNHLISLCKKRGYDKRMPAEMRHARHVQERLQLLDRLLHEVRNLDQQTITEIRHYSHPPQVVHSVMMATLLLLGHFDEETKDWSRVLVIIGRTGRQALKRRREELDTNKVALDVALGSRNLLKDITLEQVRKVSVGAATFYVWTKGVVEELETRFSEEVDCTRPRTSEARTRGGRHRKHKNGLEHL